MGRRRTGLVFGVWVFVLLVAVFGVVLNVQVVRAEPRTWTVDDDGPADFHTIQGAINAANLGDTIYVHNGTYYENVVVNKTLTLTGENRATTIIDGKGAGIVVNLIERVERAVVSCFTIQNGDYGIQGRTFGTLVPVYTGHIIDGNNIAGNRYGGIYLGGAKGNRITNNFIINNSVFGIHLEHAGNNTISNNTIVNNGHGIDFYGNSNDNTLRKNNMTNNRYNFGLILRGETYTFLYGSSPSKAGIVNDVDTSNTVNGKPIYYWVNRNNTKVPSDAGYVWLNNCNNITINGCSLTNNLQGILLLFAKNASIVNNDISGNVYGIYVGVFSSNTSMVGNTLKGNLNGIYLGDLSRFTTMRNNSMSGGLMNFGVPPDIPHRMDGSDLINDIDTSNTVDGKPMVYWIDQHDRQVPKNAGYVMLINSTNIRVEGLSLSNNVQNVFLLSSNNTAITDNSITNSIYGIDVRGYSYWFIHHVSLNTTVRRNILVDNGVGMRIRSNNSTISNNTVVRNPLGIYLVDTRSSIISGNVVVASDINTTYPCPPKLYIFYYPELPWERSRELINLQIGGIIMGGDFNIVYDNTVKKSAVGISMVDQTRSYYGVGNLIFHNNFIDNAPYQAWSSFRGSNYWDNGYPVGGNCWSDYNGTDYYSGRFQNETGSDGIGDSPYLISLLRMDYDQDRYPLMKPSPDKTPPVTIIGLSGVLGENEWFTSDVTVSLSAVDDAEVNRTECSFDNTTWITLTTSFKITTEGNTILYYNSTDKAGNTESTRTKTIKIDKTIPSGSITINNGATYTISTTLTLTLSATDTTSGVYRVRYSKDCVWDTEPWETPSTTKTWTISSGDGTKTVYYQIKDNAGLTSPTYQDSIVLDATKPSANAGQDLTVNAGTIVNFDASGSSDNMDIVSYEWNFGDETTGTGKTTTHTYTNPRTYTVTLTVKDAAGNSATDSITITVLSPEAFPVWIAGAAVAAVAAIAITAATILFLKKRK